jgi:hypothetical protein
MATVRFLSWGVIPIGAVLAGALAGAFGVRTSMAVFSVVSLTVPAIGSASRIRHLRNLADPEPAGA